MNNVARALVLACTGASFLSPLGTQIGAAQSTSLPVPLSSVGAFPVLGASASTPFTSFDQIYVDPYFPVIGALSNRSGKTVELFNALTGQAFGSTGAVFAGATPDLNNGGPDGIVIAGTQLWVGDGPSVVHVFDLAANIINPPQIALINTGGTLRADSLDYDPHTGTVIVGNADTQPTFVSLISANTFEIKKKIVFDGTNGTPDASIGGIGDVIYDPALNSFVVSLTQIGTDPTKGALAVMSTATGAITKVISGIDNCQPSSIVPGPGDNILVGCDPGFPAPDPVVFAPRTYIINGRTGAILANITQVGGEDFVAYNPQDNRYYTASRDFFTSPSATVASPVLGVIDGGTNQWVENVPDGANAHSVAVNPLNNFIFVPLANHNPLCGGLPGCLGIAKSPSR